MVYFIPFASDQFYVLPNEFFGPGEFPSLHALRIVQLDRVDPEFGKSPSLPDVNVQRFRPFVAVEEEHEPFHAKDFGHAILISAGRSGTRTVVLYHTTASRYGEDPRTTQVQADGVAAQSG
jgi:hypothetical protein